MVLLLSLTDSGTTPRKAVRARYTTKTAATVPGFFLYYPSRAQSSPALRLFVDVVRELAAPQKRAARGT